MPEIRNIDCEDWPRCAVCEIPVENFYVEVIEDGLTFTAHCHNEKETSTLTTEQIREVFIEGFDVFEAFTKRKGECTK